MFAVSCGQFFGILHSCRFLTGNPSNIGEKSCFCFVVRNVQLSCSSSGTRGLSIRTEDKWMSPVEFVREATSQTDATWRKDIIYNEEPLNALIEVPVEALSASPFAHGAASILSSNFDFTCFCLF